MLSRMSMQVGDKIRCKGARNGSRGTIVRIEGNRVGVTLTDSDETIEMDVADITNFSQAARKAWKNMPNRRVGRPRGSRQFDRISVTLRVDRDLWERFRRDEAAGAISDRTATINAWLRNMLDRLELKMGISNGTTGH